MKNEFKYAIRLMRRSPGFSITVIFVFGCAIACNLLVFSLLDAVALKSLPVKNARNLVLLKWMPTRTLPPDLHLQWTGYDKSTSLSYPTFAFLHDHNHTLSNIFGFATISSWTMPTKVNNHRIVTYGEAITDDYFTGLGIEPAIGRLVGRDLAGSNASPVLTISYDFWRREFNRNPNAVGQVMNIGEFSYVIIGVAPPGFTGLATGQNPDFWVPINEWSGTRDQLLDGANWWLTVMGTIKSGANRKVAKAELDQLFHQALLAQAAGFANQDDLLQLHLEAGDRGVDILEKQFGRPTVILMILVGVVLIISCVNICILMLTRALGRQQDTAIRISLGAPRSSLMRQSFVEGFTVAAIGGLVGVLLAYFGAHIFLVLFSSIVKGTVKIQALAPDLTLVLFASCVTLLAGIGFGIIPVWYATRTAPAAGLAYRDAYSSQRPTQFRFRDILVGSQVALSLTMILVAGLFIRTVQKLEHQDLGFVPDNILVFSMNAAKAGYSDASLVDINARFLERLKGVSNIRSVSCSTTALISGFEFALPISLFGRPTQAKMPPARFMLVGPDFFSTLGMRILQGRGFSTADFRGPGRVAVINENLANALFSDGHVLGEKIILGDFNAYQVIGIIHNLKGSHLRGDSALRVYLPFHTMPAFLGANPDGVFFEVKTIGDPIALIATVRAMAHELDPKLSLEQFSTQSEQVNGAITRERMLAEASSFFSVFILLLSCLSIYAVQSHSAALRIREVGIRIALGAERWQIFGNIVARACISVCIGILVGAGISVATTRLLASELYGVTPNDMVSGIMAVIIIICVTMLATFIPAYRASRLDAAQVLRYD